MKSRRRVNSDVRRLFMNAARTKLIVVIGSTLLLTSCQQSLAMWVVPGSTADNLVLGWSRSRDSDEKIQPEEIRVFPCDTIHRQSDGSYYPDSHLAVWAASSYDRLPTPTNRVVYGQGFAQSSAKPLTAPGCYVVIAYARESHDATEVATMGFKIAADRTVTDMPRDEYENLFR
jgi:hypothetical protein